MRRIPVFYVFLASFSLVCILDASAAPTSPKLPSPEVLISMIADISPGEHIINSLDRLGVHSEKIDLTKSVGAYVWAWMKPDMRIDIYEDARSKNIIGGAIFVLTKDKLTGTKLQNQIIAYIQKSLGQSSSIVNGQIGWVFNTLQHPHVFYMENYDNALRLVQCWQKDISKMDLSTK